MSDTIHSTLLRELSALPLEERARQLRARGDAESLLIALGDEAEKMVIGQVGSGLASAELLVALSDEMRIPAAQARARRALGQALAYSGRFEPALRACEAAVVIAEGAGEVVQAARARLSSIHALGELGRYADAVEAGERARSTLIDAGEPALAARADLNLGVICRKWDRPRKAVEHFDRAKLGLSAEPMILAQLESNRGEALLALDDLAGAEAAFRAALPVFESAGHRWGAAIVEGNLADLAVRQGRLDRALYHFESARRNLERDASPTHVARILVEQGDAKYALGMLNDALQDYQAALPVLDEHQQAADGARARAGLAPVLVRLGRLDEADHALADALAQFEALEQRSAQARLLLVRSELAEIRGRKGDALALARRALELSGDRPIDAARARHRLASLALDQGDLDEAEAMVLEALGVAEAAGVTPLVADLHAVRGRVLRARGNIGGAVEGFRAAVAALERVRGALQAERFRAAFLGDRLAAYESLVRAILDRGGAGAAREALIAAELAKSRALSDIMRGALPPAPLVAGSDEGDQLAVVHARTQADLNNWYRRLEPGTVDPSWRQRAVELEGELTAIEGRLAATGRVARGLDEANAIDKVQACLDEDEAMIEFFAAEGALVAFTVTRESVCARESPARMSDVNDLVRRVQFQIGRALRPGVLEGVRGHKLEADARHALRGLYEAVMRPVISGLNPGTRLIIVPHGSLHAIPFAALHDGGQYLIERHELRTIPSGALHARLAKRAMGACSGGSVVISVADELAPHVRREAREVASLLHPVRLLQDQEATVDAVADAVRGAALVHFACHGRFDSQNPLSSGLRMHDRWLTVRDAYRLNLAGALLVLSACETGLSRIASGDELAGLLRGFFAAGAGGSLVSLWMVEDASTTAMMLDFYGRLRDGRSPQRPAEALRGAQLELMRTKSHPAQWAPFVLVGAR